MRLRPKPFSFDDDDGELVNASLSMRGDDGRPSAIVLAFDGFNLVRTMRELLNEVIDGLAVDDGKGVTPLLTAPVLSKPPLPPPPPIFELLLELVDVTMTDWLRRFSKPFFLLSRLVLVPPKFKLIARFSSSRSMASSSDSFLRFNRS